MSDDHFRILTLIVVFALGVVLGGLLFGDSPSPEEVVCSDYLGARWDPVNEQCSSDVLSVQP